ncbi:hypothetical protein SAMN05518845_101544 [Variovorax sp. YR750]|uniref:hypothetical protein n=1 Tax=Variovorax sp. YR750 TaxID=1884384 RepID=UPI0008B08328|nr:hypothetical protein [Variovorax sp. YR750]SEK49662.1 hypothetical protein SAMN05518845_101544 [Variovorax sp. YR750]
MNWAGIFSMALVAATATAQVHAADKRYPLDFVRKIEIIDPSNRSAWENKDFLDCSDVVLTEEDVRYALQHMRRVSEKSYFGEYTEISGCLGGASVTFKNGKVIVIGIEPTGRINIFESNAKLEPTNALESFYDCAPCKERKMALLKDALNRADERRLRRLEAEGKIPPGEAEHRLKVLRNSR